MLLERKEIKHEGEDITTIEAYYDSTNIAKTQYVPERSYMFIFFNNGLVYSYSNIDRELYNKFESAESQGVFFRSEIRKKPKVYNYLREFKLYEFEKQDIKQIIEGLKSGQNSSEENI